MLLKQISLATDIEVFHLKISGNNLKEYTKIPYLLNDIFISNYGNLTSKTRTMFFQKNIKISFLILIALFILRVAPGYTQEVGVLNAGLHNFYSATDTFGKQIKPVAMRLLWYLGTIQLTINLVLVTLRQIDFYELVAAFVRSLLSIGFFIFLIQGASWLLPSIIDGFTELGKIGSGLRELTPSNIIWLYVRLQDEMQLQFHAETGGDASLFKAIKNFFPAIVLWGACMLTLAAGVILAFQMFFVQFSAYIYLALAPVLFGFGGLSHTRDIALNALKGGIVIGIKIVVVYLMAKIAMDLAPQWAEHLGTVASSMGADSKKMNPMDPVWDAALGSILLAAMALKLPDIAANALSGQASITAGSFGQVAATAGAGIATAALASKAAAEKSSSIVLNAAKHGFSAIQAGKAAWENSSVQGLSGLSRAAGAARTVAKGYAGQARTQAAYYTSLKISQTAGGRVAASIKDDTARIRENLAARGTPG